MENMRHEGREQDALSTPMLDAVLASLPPLELHHELSHNFKVVEEAKDRLGKKLEEGTLTQTDIEQELSSLPNVGGVDEHKRQIVEYLRFNVPGYDIKKLPER